MKIEVYGKNILPHNLKLYLTRSLVNHPLNNNEHNIKQPWNSRILAKATINKKVERKVIFFKILLKSVSQDG